MMIEQSLSILRAVRAGNRSCQLKHGPSGERYITPLEPLQPYARRYTEHLEHWAAVAPDRTYLAERDANGEWRKLSYREILGRVRHIAQALLNRKLPADRPIMILSENSIEYALLALAALHIGIPYAPISVGYSLISKDFEKLRYCYDLVKPSLVFAADGARFDEALKAVLEPGVELVCSTAPISWHGYTPFDQLLDTDPTSHVDEVAKAVAPDTLARILFTSGSSGMPKAAMYTHRVICSNMQIAAQVWPFILDEPPVVCDWLPWNHTFGGSQIFGKVLRSGGTLYIDGGRPIAGAPIETSVRNLKDTSPSFLFSVPAMFELLLPYLESDAEFRKAFFRRLKLLFYGAATLSDKTIDRYRTLALETTGERILAAAGWGATEIGPVAMACTWETPLVESIGLPGPGVRLKLLKNGSRLEVRVKSPSVIPGYFRQPEATANAFDEQGWYMPGDAIRFVDPENLDKGFVFDGRLAENFKLTSGTWVNVESLRTLLCKRLAPLVTHVLICGENQREVGAIVFPELSACRQLAGLPDTASASEVVSHPSLRQEFGARLDAVAKENTTSSTRIARIRLTERSLSHVEVTDKNTLSTNVVIDRRRDEISDLFDPTSINAIVAKT